MKVIIPTETDKGLEATRSAHFGHSAYFTMVTIENDKVAEVETFKNVDHDTEGCGGVINYAISLHPDAIIVRGMGVPPYTRFTQSGVAVYLDTQAQTVDEVVQDYINGNAVSMSHDDACRH